MVDTSMHFCPHTGCDYRGWLGLGNVRANGHPNSGPWRQLHCTSCEGYFPEHHGTIFHGKQAEVELIVRVLRAWLAERGNHPSKFVFVSQKSGRVHRSQFYRIFSSAAERAGLPADRRHPHVLKHSIATHLISANTNLALVRQQLGHKSINSTMRYVTTTDKQASTATASALMKIY